MALTIKALFPPVVNTTMPAFLRTESCEIYFDLSVYNSRSDINSQVQISISNQNNNLSALKTELYPTGIKLEGLKQKVQDGVNKYYVTIAPDDLEGGFALNQYYKVQLRFISSDVIIPENGLTSNWLAANQDNFSEWSSVCLIRGISTPILNIKGFDLKDKEQSIVIASQVVDFIGRLTFDDAESDSLEYYNIALYKNNKANELVGDSGIVYTNPYSPNDINYTFRKELEDGEDYKAVLHYTTKARYSSWVDFNFSIILFSIDKMNVEITAEPEPDFGRIKVNVKSLSDEKFIGNLTIRRTDSTSDFTLWDDIHTNLISTGTILDFVWYDNTVEAGVWYIYCVQKRNIQGDRGIITKIKEPVLCYFEDMFLVKDNKFIKVRFDQQVSSWKRNLVESKTDTIGSKYPFIRRNANTDYRQFQISGLITRFMDIDNEFTSEEELYGVSTKLYDNFNKTNKISKYNDYIYEREFREKVINFLHENDVTLFKTLTEGNVLVRLMDINITPNTTLGRRLYSFSATAYEIDEPTIDNFTKYNIQDAGIVHSLVQYVSATVGQLKQQYFDSGKDIIQLIADRYAEKSDSGFSNLVQSLNYLKIEIIEGNNPYPLPPLVATNGNELKYVNNSKIINNLQNNLRRGTIINLNGKDILIDESNTYEVFDATINSLFFKEEGKTAIINYGCDIEKREINTKTTSRYYYTHKVGQLNGVFNPDDNISRIIKSRYSIDEPGSYYQRLSAINGLTIWADPNTVVYIKDSLDGSNYNRFIIGDDGVLEFSKSDATIEDFYFKGVNFKQKPDNRDKPLINEYQYLDKNAESSFSSVEAAKEYTANTLKRLAKEKIKKESPWLSENEINEKVEYLNIKPHLLDRTIYLIRPNENEKAIRYICLNNKLYPIPGSNSIQDVEIPVNAMVNYDVDVVKGEYVNEA